MAKSLVVYELPDHTIRSVQYNESAYGNAIQYSARNYADIHSAVILAITPEEG